MEENWNKFKFGGIIGKMKKSENLHSKARQMLNATRLNKGKPPLVDENGLYGSNEVEFLKVKLEAINLATERATSSIRRDLSDFPVIAEIFCMRSQAIAFKGKVDSVARSLPKIVVEKLIK